MVVRCVYIVDIRRTAVAPCRAATRLSQPYRLCRLFQIGKLESGYKHDVPYNQPSFVLPNIYADLDSDVGKYCIGSDCESETENTFLWGMCSSCKMNILGKF